MRGTATLVGDLGSATFQNIEGPANPFEFEKWVLEKSPYRYQLRREWDPKGWVMTFCMLNPSRASHLEDDPTITRVIGFAKREGAGRLIVVNLCALRSTDPRALLSHDDPVGPEKEKWILQAREEARIFVCGWGRLDRPIQAKTSALEQAILGSKRGKPFCLGTTKEGYPRHPLYLRSDTPLVPYVGRN